jgi:hypothetical protein
MTFILDPKLRAYATDSQWEKLVALEKYGSLRKAADALGVHNKTISDAKSRVIKKAAQKGYAPEYDLTHPVAPGMSSKGTSINYDGEGNVKEYWNKSKQEGMDPKDAIHLPDPKTIVKLSTCYDAEGNVMQQWVAEKPDAVAQALAWEEFAKALAEDITPAEEVPVPTRDQHSDYLACYPVGDHHFGMLAWDKETGEDYDLKIAEKRLLNAFGYLSDTMAFAETGLIAFLGDFMHYDGFKPVTPTSGNLLDADSRFPKMAATAVRCMKYMIERALVLHKNVHVIVEIGNHDLSSSIFLMICLDTLYADNPRVTIDTSPMHFHYYKFGKTLIGTHHGHGAKMAALPIIMANDQPQWWADTEHRYWWTGHVHHSQTQAAMSAKDYVGCTVESFRVLATMDAWAHQSGYRSKQDMKGILINKEHGEMSRLTVNPAMFE